MAGLQRPADPDEESKMTDGTAIVHQDDDFLLDQTEDGSTRMAPSVRARGSKKER